jgi:hypothetical protein
MADLKKNSEIVKPFGLSCALCGCEDVDKLVEDRFNEGFYVCEECLERTRIHEIMIRQGLEYQPDHE